MAANPPPVPPVPPVPPIADVAPVPPVPPVPPIPPAPGWNHEVSFENGVFRDNELRALRNIPIVTSGRVRFGWARRRQDGRHEVGERAENDYHLYRSN